MSLNYILASYLEAELSSEQYEIVLQSTTEDVLKSANETVSKRWSTKLQALLQPHNAFSKRTLALQLLDKTLTYSTVSDTSDLLNRFISILSENNDELTTLVVACLKTLVTRECLPSTATPSVVKALVPHLALALPALIPIIKVSPGSVRPYYEKLHAFALHEITLGDVSLGSELFAHLYLLAPSPGIRSAWKVTAESVAATARSFISQVTLDIFAVEQNTRGLDALPALELPQLSDLTQQGYSGQIDRFISALCLLLRSETPAKVGDVPLPIGTLLELILELFAIDCRTPTKPNIKNELIGPTRLLIPSLHVAGCQLLVQLSLLAGPALTIGGYESLERLSEVIESYTGVNGAILADSTAPCLAYALAAAEIDTPRHLSFDKVVSTTLNTVSRGLKVENLDVSETQDAPIKRKKNKRQRFDVPDQKHAKQIRPIAQTVVALHTLDLLLASKAFYYCDPSVKLRVVRLLVSEASANAFLVQDAQLRVQVTRCLATISQQIALFGAIPGLTQRLVALWQRFLRDTQHDVRTLAREQLVHLACVIHPMLPPLGANAALEFAKGELVGAQSSTEATHDVSESDSEEGDTNDSEPEPVAAQEVPILPNASISLPQFSMPPPAPVASVAPVAGGSGAKEEPESEESDSESESNAVVVEAFELSVVKGEKPVESTAGAANSESEDEDDELPEIIVDVD